jgi:hypothetical protein
MAKLILEARSRSLFFRWVHDCGRPPRWMAFAFYSVERNRCLFVMYPFHFVLAALWWVQDRWARHTDNPSWIECEVSRREKKANPFSRP